MHFTSRWAPEAAQESSIKLRQDLQSLFLHKSSGGNTIIFKVDF